jgi:GNAT superfamily N-acetyltransferase
VRPLREVDLARADHVMRLAFGTFLGMSEPMSFMGDADYVFTRFAADPTAAFAAELDGQLVGSNFATNWGSVGFFGPLTVHPHVQASGLGSALMEPVMERFAAWGTRHAGLYTFADSAKHIGLYQKFGFYPRFLTCIMERAVPDGPARGAASTLSRVPKHEREAALSGCRALTNSIYEGLDLTHEIEALQRQSLGEVVLLDDEKGISGVAVCHCGSRTEAGSGVLFIKFGAVRPGPDAEHRFEQLLDACEETARARDLARVVGGVNFGRTGAHRSMSSRGYRASDLGVAMHRPNESGYSRPDVYVIDDWR